MYLTTYENIDTTNTFSGNICIQVLRLPYTNLKIFSKNVNVLIRHILSIGWKIFTNITYSYIHHDCIFHYSTAFQQLLWENENSFSLLLFHFKSIKI